MRKVANQSFTMSTLLRASQATKLTARKAVRRAESVHAGYTQYYHEAENSDDQVAPAYRRTQYTQLIAKS